MTIPQPDDDEPVGTEDEKQSVTLSGQRVPRTRWGSAWALLCAAALAAVILIVFLLQNTRSVEVSFLWLHGTLPLAVALLIAGVGSAVLTMVFGAARITQLHRLARRRHD
jgi:uncharacterized integral membrane protein